MQYISIRLIAFVTYDIIPANNFLNQTSCNNKEKPQNLHELFFINCTFPLEFLREKFNETGKYELYKYLLRQLKYISFFKTK